MKLLQMKKYCIFDLDGTLIDSMGEWTNSILAILNSEGISYPKDFFRTVTALGSAGAADWLIKHGVRGTKEELLDRINAYAYQAYAERIPLKSGVKEALCALKEAGCRLYVLTASPHITTDAALARNGVITMFDRIFTIEDLGLDKSTPEIYRKTAACIGALPEEIAFFDDNLTALSAAKAANLLTIGVYDRSSENDTAEIRRITDEYIVSFSEIKARLL